MEYLDRIAEGYEGTLGKPLKEKSRQRIDWICDHVQGNKVLDIGCSQGICEVLLGRRGFQVTGVDIAEESIAYAQTLLSKEPFEVQRCVQLLCANFLTDVEWNETFDTILLTEILEHLEKPGEMVEKAARMLSDGGTMIVTVPFGINDFPDHKHTFYMADIGAILTQWVQIDHVEFMGGWIGFLCTKTGCQSQIKEFEYTLVRREEEAFFKLERPLRDYINQVTEKYKKAEENYQTAKQWVQSKDDKIAQLNEANEKKLAQVSQQSEMQIQQAKKDLETRLQMAKEAAAGELRQANAAAEEKLRALEFQRAKENQDAQKQLDSRDHQLALLGEENAALQSQVEQLRQQLRKDEKMLQEEETFLQQTKQQLLLLNTKLQQAQRQNKVYEEKLNKVYGTWYGRIVLKTYKFLKKIKNFIIKK